MAIAYVGEVGTATGSGTSLACTVSRAPSSRNLITLRVGFRASGTVTATGVADTQGNTWNIDSFVDTSGGHALVASTTMDVATLTGTDSVTVSLSGSAGNGIAMALDEFSGVDPTVSRVDKTASNSGASATTRDAGTTANTTSANAVVVAAFGMNGTDTSFTAGSGYTGFTTKMLVAAVGTASTMEGEYQIVSATGAYNPTGTGGTALTWSGATAVYKQASAATKTITPAGASGAATVSATVATGYTQAQLQGSPWFWVFGTGLGGQVASRRQEGGMVNQYGATLTELLVRITAYEASLAAKGVPVSPEWGQLWGATAANRVKLRIAGEEYK